MDTIVSHHLYLHVWDLTHQHPTALASDPSKTGWPPWRYLKKQKCRRTMKRMYPLLNTPSLQNVWSLPGFDIRKVSWVLLSVHLSKFATECHARPPEIGRAYKPRAVDFGTWLKPRNLESARSEVIALHLQRKTWPHHGVSRASPSCVKSIESKSRSQWLPEVAMAFSSFTRPSCSKFQSAWGILRSHFWSCRMFESFT